MNKLFKRKLNKWLGKAIDEVKLNGLTQDIHLDEIFKNDFQLFSKAEVLLNSYLTFDYVVNYITKENIDMSDINIFLSIDLECESHIFNGPPKSLTEIESLIDLHSIPEIIVYHDPNPNKISLNEFYRIPLVFEPFIGDDSITMFYKEYRSLEEHFNNSVFTKDINIVYNK
ncbi:hypothetical protein EOD41_17315 [Mucilaginibacter limnophilus]|uniref:Uncharacterized protein n=1 Tax=Mucilaginibacter limnophilus TaxID=1932778 RepID=A0A3S2UM48_9SPHI|nr:hypothetical protein [Mucilaginibacter limnophilus]RVT98130.1 hypothetical protein EOD41_17315 [Mucilaginibacter limnophilus]